MRIISYAAFLLVFISPLSTFAQALTHNARYCPDPTQVFTGIATDASGKPKIELLVDPDFEGKMKVTRSLETLPVTPVYALVIRAVPPINEYCLRQYDADGRFVEKVDPPHLLPFSVYFALGNEILLTGDAVHFANQNTETGEPYYEWEKKGWPNGIFVPDKLEKVIKAVQANDPTLRIGALVELPNKPPEKMEKPISFTLCVPLSGGSPHKVVSMRGKSSGMNIHTLVMGAERYREDGFESIEPFKTYRRYFAHFVDLVSHDDTGWSRVFNMFFLNNMRPRRVSTCGDDGSQYFFHTGWIKDMHAYAPYGGGIAFLSSGNGGFMSTEVAMHETGHSFGWLEDEYHSGFDLMLYYANCAPADLRNSSLINSAVGGDKILRNRIERLLRRAYWDPYGDTVSGCHTNGQYRPSTQSLMNSGDFRVDRFNVVSCGYLLRAITGRQELKPLWQECMKMGNEVERPAIVPSDIISATFPFFSQMRDGLLASVAAPQVTTDARNIDQSRFIEVEEFLSNGDIKSNVFENTGTEENPSWRQIPVEVSENANETAVPPSPVPNSTATTPSPTSDLGVDTESVFDSVFVDLKVNGQDGPVTVAPRSRIVVSWLSEGATRCRANWTKNDIKASGTAAGRISRTATIKAACINAEGERADDAVVVNVSGGAVMTPISPTN